MAPGGWSTDGDGHARLTGHLSFTFEDPLRALPENLSPWFLDMTACSRFELWPREGTIHHGALILRTPQGERIIPLAL